MLGFPIHITQNALDQPDCRIFQTPRSQEKIKHEFSFLHVTWHPLEQQIDLVFLVGSGQARQGVPRYLVLEFLELQ